jgi:hypothetical protein
MEQELVNLIGAEDGAQLLYSDWVNQARAANLRPEVIQRLKRKRLVHTILDENGQVFIVRGARPQPEPIE